MFQDIYAFRDIIRKNTNQGPSTWLQRALREALTVRNDDITCKCWCLSADELLSAVPTPSSHPKSEREKRGSGLSIFFSSHTGSYGRSIYIIFRHSITKWKILVTATWTIEKKNHSLFQDTLDFLYLIFQLKTTF